MESVAYGFGYDEILVSVIERASSFSENIVGQSPWPEWDPRGCFFFEITDYNNGFLVEKEKVSVVLIPEGTISVARWLGLQISNNPDLVFPIKFFPIFKMNLLIPCCTEKSVSLISLG